MKTGRALVLVAATVVAASACEAPRAWGPNASFYNSNKVVEGWGEYYNDRATYARSRMTVADSLNDGNTVYGKTGFYFFETTSTSPMNAVWSHSRTKSTGEWANQVRTVDLFESLHAQAAKSRGQMQACAQMGWPVPDSCAPTALITFDY